MKYLCCFDAFQPPCWEVTSWNPGKVYDFSCNVKMPLTSRGKGGAWAADPDNMVFCISSVGVLKRLWSSDFCRRCFPSRNIGWHKGWSFLNFLSHFCSSVDKFKTPSDADTVKAEAEAPSALENLPSDSLHRCPSSMPWEPRHPPSFLPFSFQEQF